MAPQRPRPNNRNLDQKHQGYDWLRLVEVTVTIVPGFPRESQEYPTIPQLEPFWFTRNNITYALCHCYSLIRLPACRVVLRLQTCNILAKTILITFASFTVVL